MNSSVVQIFVTDAAGSKQTHVQQSNKYPLPKRTRMSVVPHSSDVFCFAKNSRQRIDKDVHSEAARIPLVPSELMFSRASNAPFPNGQGCPWFHTEAMFFASAKNSRPRIDKDVNSWTA